MLHQAFQFRITQIPTRRKRDFQVEHGDSPISSKTDDLRPAEVRLLDSVRNSQQCDLIDRESEPSSHDIGEWTDEDRMIRAQVLRRVLVHGYLNADNKVSLDAVSVRGAVIVGDLELSDARIYVALTLEHCRIAGIDASRTIFTHNAWFRGTTFHVLQTSPVASSQISQLH